MDTKKTVNKNKPGFKKIIKISGNVLFAIVFVVAVLLILSKFSIGGMRTLTVKSGSMSPTIHTGSVIFVTPANDYKVNDIITFRAQGEKELITHRITEVDQTGSQPYYWTKGDANDATDSYKVPKNGVAGKVQLSVPLLGYIIEFVKKPLGLILIIIIPATIIIYEEIKTIRKEWKKYRHEKKEKEKMAVKNSSSPSAQANISKKEKIWTALTKHRKIFILAIALTASLLYFNSALAVTVTAGDLTISYPGDGALFNELNLAPGAGIQKTVTITNNSGKAQDIGIKVTKQTDPGNLGSMLSVIIKKGETELYGGSNSPKHLSDLFSAGEVYLSTLAIGATTDYDFIVSFDGSADNSFQGKTSVFSFSLGFTGTPTTIAPSPSPAPTLTPRVLGEETEKQELPPASQGIILGAESVKVGASLKDYILFVIGIILVTTGLIFMNYLRKEKSK